MDILEEKSERKLPKLYRVIEVNLDTLRPYIVNGGVCFDGDATVKRKVRRVLCSDGWKWQIAKIDTKQYEWDYFLEEDEISLDEYRSIYRMN